MSVSDTNCSPVGAAGPVNRLLSFIQGCGTTFSALTVEALKITASSSRDTPLNPVPQVQCKEQHGLAKALSQYKEPHGLAKALSKQGPSDTYLRGSQTNPAATGPVVLLPAELRLKQKYDANGAKIGHVYLVGAGPGDIKMLTLEALQTIQQADVILYDGLISQEVLDLCPRKAIMKNVGKIKGQCPAAQQEAIHTLCLEHAATGVNVVRLKSGDPFIYGRAGEELKAMREAGVECSVVAGVSSITGAATAALMPLTYRKTAASFAVFSGHESDDRCTIDWEVASRIQTAVFLMGVAKLPLITRRLIEAGRPPSTPIAIIERGTWPNMRTVFGTLETIVDIATKENVKPPSICVVGDVVDVSKELRTLSNLM